MSILESVKLLKVLPDLKEIMNCLKEHGYQKIEKIIGKEQISVSAISPEGSKYTELWNAKKDVHLVIHEPKGFFDSQKDELLREKLDGTPLSAYSKSTITNNPMETIYLYMEKPFMMYKRILDKATGVKQYFKRIGNGKWERLWEPKQNEKIMPKTTENDGVRIKHNVVEKDNTISTYLLNTQTQNIYKRTTDGSGKHQYYKITPNGLINLFPKI